MKCIAKRKKIASEGNSKNEILYYNTEYENESGNKVRIY